MDVKNNARKGSKNVDQKYIVANEDWGTAWPKHGSNLRSIAAQHEAEIELVGILMCTRCTCKVCSTLAAASMGLKWAQRHGPKICPIPNILCT